MKKSIALVLALILCVGLAIPVVGVSDYSDGKTIGGNVRASDLPENTYIGLDDDTVLTLDTDKTIRGIIPLSTLDKSLIIKGTGTLTVVEGIYGIGEFSIESGKLDTLFIMASAITVNGGTIECSPNEAVMFSGTSGTVFAESITVTNGTLLADSGSSGPNNGICAKRLSISGGTVEAQNSSFRGCGIAAIEMVVSGGSVTASGKYRGIGDDYYEMPTDWKNLPRSLSITGGTVEAQATDDWTSGIYAWNVSITGGTVSAKGGKGAIGADTQIYLGDSIQILEPVGAYTSTEKVKIEEENAYWDAYSILSANGVLAAEVSIGESSATPVAPASISVSVNGNAVQWTDAAPFIDANSRTMVPLRAVADAMKLDVSWDGDTREAIFKDGDKMIAFPIDSTSARTNTDDLITMDTAAVIVNSRTYAPIRYLAEFFGYTVDWDGANRTVVIT